MYLYGLFEDRLSTPQTLENLKWSKQLLWRSNFQKFFTKDILKKKKNWDANTCIIPSELGNKLNKQFCIALNSPFLESDLDVNIKHASWNLTSVFINLATTQKHLKTSKISWKQTILFAINFTNINKPLIPNLNTHKRRHANLEQWLNSHYQ